MDVSHCGPLGSEGMTLIWSLKLFTRDNEAYYMHDRRQTFVFAITKLGIYLAIQFTLVVYFRENPSPATQSCLNINSMNTPGNPNGQPTDHWKSHTRSVSRQPPWLHKFDLKIL
jgi:hypothetical protein